jgi:pSer/pThr/pTyr-binding forkhead associated (FHA) protein
MSALVFVEERPMEGRVIHPANGLTIGREGCDVVLPDPEVSRRHAVIREYEVGTSIEDLGSKNGTFVNGEPVRRVTVLSTGDHLRFGNTIWRVSAASQAEQMS